MTGWRVGWIQAPKILGPVIERVIQYNTSGTPVFLQRGCVTALDEGEDFIEMQVNKARKNRDTVIDAMKDFQQVRLGVPDGAFYAFFGIKGMTDSMVTALRIVDEANVGFAPGNAFGQAGEGYLRMCYLKEEHKLAEGLDRFTNWLKNNQPA